MKFTLLIKLILPLLFACIMLTACEKIDVPDPDKENPVFEVSFQDGSSNIILGGNSTELISKVSWDDQNIRVFEGSLVNTKDESSLTFRMRDNRISKPDIANDTLALFIPGEYSFFHKSQSIGMQKVLVNKLHNMEYHDRVVWKYGSIPDASGAYFNIVDFNPDELIFICMSMKHEDTNGEINFCKQMVYNISKIPFEGFSLNKNILSPDIDPSFAGDLIFEWNNEEKESHIITQKGKLQFEVKYNPENKEATAGIYSSDMYVDLDNEGNALRPILPGFESKLVVFERPPDFSKIEIVWVNEAGKEFTSANISQSDLAEFNITEISTFPIRNQDGHRVKKIDVNFSCTLQAEDGEKVVINNGEGSIGFSYF